MQCPKIRRLLSEMEIRRLKEILRAECGKAENSNAGIAHYIESIEETTYHEYFKDALFFLKNYRKKIDLQIKSKLKEGLNQRRFDLKSFQEKTKQKYYKFKQKNWKPFIKRSEYFFSLYTGPLNFSGINNKDYLNRAYLGFGFEFLLKAIFLKNCYLINKVLSEKQFKSKGKKKPCDPIKLGKLNKEFIKTEVNELGYFIRHLQKIKPKNIENRDFDFYILAGLKIAQNWRNQDIHVPTEGSSTNIVIQQHLKYSHDLLYKIFLPKRKIPNFSIKM